MSDRKRLNIILPEWFQVELQTQKTITRLSGVHELLFYLNNPDEYIRHQAVMRLGQLGGKEIITPLNKIIEDSLEITLNRELAAWILKSTGLIGNDDYFIGNNYLDRFTGNEKLKDFYYPSFTEGSSAPEYHFAASGIGALLLEETLMIRAESQETNVEIPFSFAQWLKVWSKTKRDNLRKGLEAMREKSAAATAGFTQKIMHPDKTAYKKKQKRFQITKQKPAAEKNPLQIKWPELSEESQTLHEASPELLSGEYETLLETRFEFLSKEAKTIYEATPELLSEEYEPLLETTAEFLSEEDQTLYESVSEISVEENHPDHSENIAIHITESVSRQEERTENHNMGISVAQTQNIESRKTGIQGVQIKNAAGSEASDQVSVNIIRNEPVNSISVTAATAEKMKPEVRNLLYPEKNAPVEVQDKESRQADVELKPDHYIKPFKLKSCPEEKEKKTNRTKSKIYVRKNAHELSFADVLKGLV
ncbi:MAG: hypothetical protein KBA53_13550, partial [Thermoclostridium sp.]|nr:hypothetical protein [Thermoclostridium sp.]